MATQDFIEDQANDLKRFELYVINQGDKFHPLSDNLLAVIESHEQAAQDSLTGYVPEAAESLEIQAEEQDALLRDLVGALDAYERAPKSPYHSYHIDRLRGMLDSSEEDAD